MGDSRFVVAGGAIAGLATALILARAGAEVTLVERDVIPDVDDPEAAFALERQGVPQSHFLHAFLARMVKVMRERLPDVLDDLVAAGATIERPPMSREAADDDLCLLLARRTTVEWVLRRRVAAEAGVRMIGGRTVAGITGAGRQVTGAVLDDGTELAGSVVACTGRRSDIGSWLAPLGVTIEEQQVQSELVYITRWYRAPEFNSGSGGLLRDLGYLSYLVVPADGDTLAVAVGLPPDDRELRTLLLDDRGFDRVARMLPGLGEEMARCEAVPIRSSQPMAGLVNRLRRFVDASGSPLVTGFHAVGDAHTCTNPAYGRGCSLALVQAALLADAFAAHRDDPVAVARAYEQASAVEVEPWYHSSVLMDAARSAARERLRGSSSSGASGSAGVSSSGGPSSVGPSSVGPPSAGSAAASEPGSRQPDVLAVLQAVASGAVTDPVLLGGFARLLHLLVTPAQLFSDAEFTGRLIELAAHPPAPAESGRAPTRDEMLAASGAPLLDLRDAGHRPVL